MWQRGGLWGWSEKCTESGAKMTAVVEDIRREVPSLRLDNSSDRRFERPGRPGGVTSNQGTLLAISATLALPLQVTRGTRAVSARAKKLCLDPGMAVAGSGPQDQDMVLRYQIGRR